MSEPQIIRKAERADVEALTELWFNGWRDAHAAIVPADLARQRTRESFRERMAAAFETVRVAQSGERVLGFHWITGDELNQFYVAAEARGTGVAAQLLADALGALRAAGVRTPWLACAIGNDRAARFYEKAGWTRAGVVTSELATPAGIFLLNIWRYEFRL